MTPRERAIKSLTLLRQNASKRNATYSQCFLDDMADVIEQAIIADRQALQSEICKKMELIKRMEGLALLSGLPVYNMIVGIIQSIFAQQSPPEESKPERLMVSIADAQKEEAYKAGLKSNLELDFEPWKGKEIASNWIQQKIRARSNQPEEKPNLTPFDPECSTCVREADEAADRAAKRVERMISSADRIATLQEWLAKDAQTIEQLNESNQKLSEENLALREKVRRLERDHFGSILAAAERDRQKIAQLEKEKNELEIKERERRETRSDWHTHFCDKPGCETTACECPTNYLSAS